MEQGGWMNANEGIGTCQERSRRRERHDSDYEWEVGDGDVAGDLNRRNHLPSMPRRPKLQIPGREDVTE